MHKEGSEIPLEKGEEETLKSGLFKRERLPPPDRLPVFKVKDRSESIFCVENVSPKLFFSSLFENLVSRYGLVIFEAKVFSESA